LIRVNCAALPATLIESELFGHVAGAFTGAVSNKQGLFEAASGGTIFLDEIGEMPSAMQVKLLKVLEDGEVRPIGATATRTVDIRLISATNKNLKHEIERGTFRQDLFYRINLFTVTLPPLRERVDDIALLAEDFLNRYQQRTGQTKSWSEAALARLKQHGWPGNVRELQNVIERCALVSGEVVLEQDVPGTVEEGQAREQTDALSIEAYTKKVIVENQDQCSETELARILGITRKTLWEKRKKWQLFREDRT
jgi:transcriptional regulator with PAS, ATPase and Fis domain